MAWARGSGRGRWTTRRRRRARRLAAVCLAAALAAGLAWAGPRLAACAAALPEALRGWAAPAFAAQLDALREENFALRSALADALPLAEENAALRALLECPARPPGRAYLPARVTARMPGAMTLYCAGGAPAAGAAVLDRRGHYAGRVRSADGHTLTVAVPGSPALLIGEAAGVLQADADGWQAAGLALPAAPAPGTPALTADGFWAGVLAAAPEADPGGLTAHAPLTDTADLADCLYFVACDQKTVYNA